MKLQNQSLDGQFSIRKTLITRLNDPDFIKAFTFDNSGSLMFATSGKQIKVWKFICRPKLLRKLDGHNYDVQFLIFSKKVFWFASSDFQGKILCWNDQWISTSSDQSHLRHITQLLLNSNEDELISCSFDKTIKVWEVDCQKNQIQYKYYLEQKHANIPVCLCMNQSETYLVTSEQTKKILWIKDNGQWKYQNQFKHKDKGYKACFINNQLCGWFHRNDSVCEILEIKDGQLIERQDLIFKTQSCEQDWSLSQTIINKQIIIWCYGQYIYFLKKQTDDKLKMISDPIDCLENQNYHTLTQDGKYLVVWNDSQRCFIIYRI